MSTADTRIIGDVTAPPGSLPWCKAKRFKTQRSLAKAVIEARDLRYGLRQMRDDGSYVGLPRRNGGTFTEWGAFCAEEPPWGFGKEPADVETIITAADDRTLLLAVKGARDAYQTHPKPIRSRRRARRVVNDER